MRRKDREMPKEFAEMVTDTCEWAVISMIDTEGSPYCVPVSIVRDNDIIYFHCAKEGFKTNCLQKNNAVCIACVGHTFRLPNEFTTEYESAIIRGKAYPVAEEAEKVHALELLCQRHTPSNMINFQREMKRSLAQTAVWKIEVSAITGKRKKYDKNGVELKFGKMEEES